MSLSRISIVECGVARATLATFAAENGRLRCEELRSESFRAVAMGDAAWGNTVAGALRRLRRKARRTGPAILLPPPSVVLLKHVRTPRVDAAKRAQVLRLEVEQALPCPIAGVSWDSVVAAERSESTDVLLAAAKHAAIEPLCDAAEWAGLGVLGVMPAALAFLAGVQAARRGQAIVAVQAAENWATVVQCDDRGFAVRALPLPMDGIAEAEVAARLTQEVIRSTLYFQRQHDLAVPGQLLVAGLAATLPVVREQLAAQLHLSPAGESKEAGETAPFSSELARAPQLAGAAAIHLAGAAGRIDLLPPHWRTRADWRRRKPWLMAAAMLALAALLPPILHFHRVSTAATAEARRGAALLASWREEEERYRTEARRLEALREEVGWLYSVHQRRTSWLRFIPTLQASLVEMDDVWLERLRLLPVVAGEPQRVLLAGGLREPIRDPGSTTDRMKMLVAALVASPFVSAVEAERFSHPQPGALRFELVLVIDSENPL